ncbi:MAG: methyltransferase [Rhodospirillaceae bacterium]|nr:methyltransferase [Rhodospirillaceae bacterium]|tara:strand:- start:19412 stop:20161 length:750 start_codon:yes stop_codon:yes gene_type:complete
MNDNSQFEFRKRIYDRYLTAGSADIPFENPDAAPGGLLDMLRSVVQKHFPSDKDSTILDLGCGAGLLVHCATQAGYTNVSGVDISQQQVEAAERLGIKNIRQGDAMEALTALEPASHDAIVSFDILEHMTRQELVVLIDGVHAALKPGGLWIIHTANAEGPFYGRVRYGDLTHEQAFTQTSLPQILIASDFSKVSCFEDPPIPGRFGGTIRWLMWKVVKIPALLWLVAESGPAGRHAILTQNLLAVAEK